MVVKEAVFDNNSETKKVTKMKLYSYYKLNGSFIKPLRKRDVSKGTCEKALT